jgi:transposase
LQLAHPRQTKAIAAARVKTDAVDARTLAQLLRADLLPEACVAPRELREVRELLRHRIALTRLRTALKNRVHALLARQGSKVAVLSCSGRAGDACSPRWRCRSRGGAGWRACWR